MFKKLFVIVLALLALVPAAASAQESAPTSDGVAVTIYNQGRALVQDRRTFTFEAGESVLNFTDVASQIDATSVSFVSLTDPAGTVVLEQNYVYDLVGADALFQRYLDEAIEVTLTDGTQFSGSLLSARGGSVIVQTNDGGVLLVEMADVRDVQFPRLPDGLITRPTLRWTVSSANAGDQQVELTYLTGSINWTADYNLLLGNGNEMLDLNGWVTITNTSGTAYPDALVKLVAGDVNRLPEMDVMFEQEMALDMAVGAVAPRGATQREFFEYQLYEINRRVTLGNNETKQVEFVTGTEVPATTYFVYNASPRFYGYSGPIADQGYGYTGITDVQNYLEFDTGEENGLGADLPAGRVRVYQEDVDGAALLIGENRIDHTPEGETVALYLGNAFDLVGERTQTNFEFISRTVIEETYEIKLRNRKDEDTVEIRVPETLYRWSNWEIISTTDDFEKLNSNSIEFRVDVAPGEERVIRYTVRYSFPN
jgi:hypothetical protein